MPHQIQDDGYLLAVPGRLEQGEGVRMTHHLTKAAHELIKTDPALAHEVRRLLDRAPMPLTRPQAECLDQIKAYWTLHGRSPSMNDLAHRLNRTKSNVHRYVECLIERGHIERIPNRARSIQLRGVA